MYILLIRLAIAASIALSLISIFNPRLSWKIQKGWKFKNAEPSDAYLLATRIGGIIGTIVCFYVFLRI